MNNLYSAPWEKFMGEVPMHLDYPQGTMFDAVNEQASLYPNNIAFDFMGSKVTYKQMVERIINVAKALKAYGIKENDHVIVAMPNSPQAIYMFYAINYVGAISHMIHPLSAEKEILFYINDSNCKLLLTIDAFYEKFNRAIIESHVETFLLASMRDVLSPIMKIGYDLTTGKKVKKLPKEGNFVKWNDFYKKGKDVEITECNKDKDETAVVLYSGGTTGTSKGIALTNYNFNALSRQVRATNPMFAPGDKMLAAMPLFHGFGLCVCVHTMLAVGGRCILVPRFTAESYAKLIYKKRCNFIAGVPTLYEALTRLDSMNGKDLSCLKGVFSGGDSLSIELKKKFDKFLLDHKATIQIREGYGTTECVTASCLTPITEAKEGSIGIPFPDTYYKIVEAGTLNELPYGSEGEIVLTGPTVMKEYTNNEEETKATLEIDSLGNSWIHTGDLGIMDNDGFIYFKGRIKRMIISSGYNVYPAQIENIVEKYEAVQMSCAIGVPDSYKMQKVKVFVTLKQGYTPSDETKENILKHCKQYIPKYAMPYDVEFRDTLPTTLVGKVAYRVLEEEELKKYQ